MPGNASAMTSGAAHPLGEWQNPRYTLMDGLPAGRRRENAALINRAGAG